MENFFAVFKSFFNLFFDFPKQFWHPAKIAVTIVTFRRFEKHRDA